MTTIAFDGTYFAADRGVSLNGMIVQRASPKVGIFGLKIMATCGCDWSADILKGWFLSAYLSQTPRSPPSGLSGDVELVVLDGGNLGRINELGGVSECLPPFATGSGGQIAMGAMAAGATAIEAVQIACRLDPNSRYPVDYVLVNEANLTIRTIHEDTQSVRRAGEGLGEVRLPPAGANGGVAHHPQHQGEA